MNTNVRITKIIKAFEIGGFKAFAKPQRLPLRPITLIFGPNSAGKSAAIRGFAYASGQELGNYSSFHNRTAPYIQWSFEYTGHILERISEHRTEIEDLIPRALCTDGCKISASVVVGKAPDDTARFQEAEIYIDNELVIHIQRGERGMKIKHIQIKHPIFELCLEGAQKDDVRKQIEKEFVFGDSRLNLISPNEIYDYEGQLRSPDSYFDRMAAYTDSVVRCTCCPYLLWLKQLGPLRAIPDTFFEETEGDPYTELIRKPKIVTQVNAWLTATTELSRSYQIKLLRRIYKELDVIVAPRMDHEGDNIDLEGSPAWKETDKYRLLIADADSGHKATLQDVGTGISQFLPILITAYATERSLIAVEQPELHLHPALQAEIGDVFIRSALGEQQNTFILETHSEHLILRIMRRMRETYNGNLPEGLPPITPDDVSVLYVQPTPSGSIIRVLELDAEGQLLDPWPGGFFEEGFKERFL